MKKRTFLLIEVLIAFSLVLLCAVPLVTGPLKVYKQQKFQLVEIEKERLADWAFSEIKEKLFKNEIPWSKIPEKGEYSSEFNLPDAVIEIPGCLPVTIKRTFILNTSGEKKYRSTQLTRQVNVIVFLNESKYKFRTPVMRVFPEENISKRNVIEK